MTNRLMQAIESEDVKTIQTRVMSFITTNPVDSKREVQRAIEEIDAKGLAVWAEHDGSELITDEKKWTKDYFAELQSHLIVNFSKECVEHILKVGQIAYKEELHRPQPEQKSAVSQPSYNRTNSNNVGKILGVGLAVVATVAVVYWIFK